MLPRRSSPSPAIRPTLPNDGAMLPIGLVVHAAVVKAALPHVLKVLVLTLTATALVIWAGFTEINNC